MMTSMMSEVRDFSGSGTVAASCASVKLLGHSRVKSLVRKPKKKKRSESLRPRILKPGQRRLRSAIRKPALRLLRKKKAVMTAVPKEDGMAAAQSAAEIVLTGAAEMTAAEATANTAVAEERIPATAETERSKGSAARS